MNTRQFSPDVLAANPELARTVQKSRAQTPSGKGRGHTDDAQDYETPAPPARETYRRNTLTFYSLLRNPRLQRKLLTELPEVKEPLDSALSALRRLHHILGDGPVEVGK